MKAEELRKKQALKKEDYKDESLEKVIKRLEEIAENDLLTTSIEVRDYLSEYAKCNLLKMGYKIKRENGSQLERISDYFVISW